MLSKILPLEVLTDNEVELATTTLALTRCRVEAPTPVDTHHTDNWQIEANTDTGEKAVQDENPLPASRKPST